MLRRVSVGVALAATLGALSVGAVFNPFDDSQAKDASPVIAVHGRNGYPAAEISGRLGLVHGCLLVGDSVAFWAEGTSWDGASQSVVFESADPVRVGDTFVGGGGHYTSGNLAGLDGVDVESVIDCLNRTDADGAVVATP